MMPPEARNESMDSNRGTGIRPGSSIDPETRTSQDFASRSTARTSPSDSAPLMMYRQIACGGWVRLSWAMVRMQIVPKQPQIAFEVGGHLVSRRACRGLEALLQLMQDVRKKSPVALLRVLLAPEKTNAGDRAFVLRQPREKFLRNVHLPK